MTKNNDFRLPIFFALLDPVGCFPFLNYESGRTQRKEMETSVKMKEFLSGPMGDKPVSTLPGVDCLIESRLIAEVGPKLL